MARKRKKNEKCKTDNRQPSNRHPLPGFTLSVISFALDAARGSMSIHLVIHGHFYQPPRENPWTGTIERQESAAPFHDWNARIAEECYLPNAHSRILDEHGRIQDIVSNYERMSFNFGPTLLGWAADGASADPGAAQAGRPRFPPGHQAPVHGRGERRRA